MQLPERQAHRFPLGKVFGNGDASALASGLPDAEVLFESVVAAHDGGLVFSQLRVDVVGGAVDVERAFEGTRSAVGRSPTGLGAAPVVEDVVLDRWLERPTV